MVAPLEYPTGEAGIPYPAAQPGFDTGAEQAGGVLWQVQSQLGLVESPVTGGFEPSVPKPLVGAVAVAMPSAPPHKPSIGTEQDVLLKAPLLQLQVHALFTGATEEAVLPAGQRLRPPLGGITAVGTPFAAVPQLLGGGEPEYT